MMNKGKLSLGKRIGLSFMVAFMFVSGDYFLDNCPYPLFDDVDTLGFAEFFTGRMNAEVDDSVLYLNVSYDKALAPVIDDFGDTIGASVITDRLVLLRLLNDAKKADYRFMVLDVRFEKGLTTNCDSVLWDVMANLPRFAYSAHSDAEDAAAEISGQSAAISDYGATLTTGFTRWQYLQPAGESMPLVMYKSIDNGQLNKIGPLYFDRGRLCRNTLFVPLSVDLQKPYRENNEVRYPLLGGHIMRWNNDDELVSMMKDRIVIIGDFEGDTHDTYIGSVPGPAIIHAAYLRLHHGGHLVNMWFVVIMLIIYAIMCFSVLTNGSLLNRLSWLRKYPVVQILLSFVGWEFALSVIGILMYIVFAESFISILPATTFTAIGWIKQRLNASDGK